MHRRVATYHAARAHGRQAVAVRAIMQGALTQVSVRAAREQAGLWPAGSWLRPGRWCRLLTATSPTGRRCQCCSCCGCRCMSACARRHCCSTHKRARARCMRKTVDCCTLRGRVGATITLRDRRRAARRQESCNKRRKLRFERFVRHFTDLRLESASCELVPQYLGLISLKPRKL